MTPEEADERIRGLGDDAAEDWIFAARDAQLPPPDLVMVLAVSRRPRCLQITLDVGGGDTAERAGISRIHFIAQQRPTSMTSTSRARAASSRPVAVIRGRAGYRCGDGWNG